MAQRISQVLAVILWAILISCSYKLLTPPSPPGVLYNGSVVDELPAFDVRLADYDGDTILDAYSVRSELCTRWTTRCTGEVGATIAPRQYEHSVTITKGGSNANIILKQIFWSSSSKIEASAWATTGELAVKIGGKWQAVPWTAPKGIRSDI